MPLVTLEPRGPNGAIALVTLNQPETLNSLSMEVLDELHGVCETMRRRDSPFRVVVLRGSGKGFCGGANLTAAYTGKTGAKWDFTALPGQEAFSNLIAELVAIPQPVIALVHGAAAGGGMSLALAADVRLAGKSASFRPSFVQVGLSGCELGSSLLCRHIGPSNASLCLMTGSSIEADDALRLGLVSMVVPDAQLTEAGLEVATRMVKNASPIGLVLTKRLTRAAMDGAPMQTMLNAENTAQLLCINAPGNQAEMKSRASAFRERSSRAKM